MVWNVYMKTKLINWNSLHDKMNPSKHAKNLNRHYSPILHGCTNTWNVKGKIKNFRILFDSGYSSSIVTRSPIEKINNKKDAVIQCHKQAGNIFIPI